jgi:selenocysteine lyase/cysteine desulfurase
MLKDSEVWGYVVTEMQRSREATDSLAAELRRLRAFVEKVETFLGSVQEYNLKLSKKHEELQAKEGRILEYLEKELQDLPE